ncbi:MgtC/SapB family protein [Pseudoxanthomonas helianthi]|uniref:Protein MgtC n=1 Tax=Pseudoxanthomonas helianthi TaxID=1453541 RepID=A0A941ASD1_9GAMM|nr:MgtC/SapB family protein [Pseudoxanthomonas helianthi]MBP3983400.1 MgtC/SapB family protein [Pseudoxanthomonas helianthi]
MPDMDAQGEVIAKMAFAMLLGGAIGLEREIKDRPAGFRTHMLVAAAAAMLTGMGSMMLATLDRTGMQIRIDPFRLMEAVISGVAFIGAGTIFAHRGAAVVGITTAASLLMVAVIGIACGLGYPWLALLATALTLVVLTILSWVDRRMSRRQSPHPPQPGEGHESRTHDE